MVCEKFMQEGGARGVVIIISAFMIQLLAFGTTASIGVYNIELLDYFNQATVGVSLIGSINFGVFLGSGPIVSLLMTKVSYRKIALFGSFLITLGLIGMPLLPYIPTMCLAFGVLAGFGSSCVYIPSHLLSGLYYEKYRSLATGVATSGSGLGGAVMPVVVGKLIEIYSWKGSFIVLAGLCLHLFVFSTLLVMPKPDGPREVEFELSMANKGKGPDESSEQATPLVREADRSETPESEIQVSEKAKNNASPKFDELTVKKSALSDRHSSSVGNVNANIGQQYKATSMNVVYHCISLQDGGKPSLLNTDKEDVKTPWGSGPVLAEGIAQPLTHSSSSLHAAGSRGSGYLSISNGQATNQSGDAPPEKSSPPTARTEIASQPKKPKASKHIYIFTNYGFNVFFISNIAWNAGCAIITAFAPEFLREEGLTAMEGAWMLGSFGFGTFLGGVIGGVMGNMACVNRQVLYSTANIVMGILIILFPNLNHIAAYATALTLSGLAFGIILGLLVIVLTDLIGIESLGNGLGYLMLSNGLGTFLGPPVAGLLRGMTGGFKVGIIFAGVLCIFGGLAMLLMFCPCQKPSSKSDEDSSKKSAGPLVED